MAKYLYIDTKSCKACGACEELCPEVFKCYEDLGYAQILPLESYPEEKIEQAIIACPARCIYRDEISDREYFCQKYQENIKGSHPICRHPNDYCPFRAACPIHYIEKEGAS